MSTQKITSQTWNDGTKNVQIMVTLTGTAINQEPKSTINNTRFMSQLWLYQLKIMEQLLQLQHVSKEQFIGININQNQH